MLEAPRMTFLRIAFCSLVLIAAHAMSEPVITGANERADGSIEVKGSGFGGGPRVVLFDDFEGGAPGEVIPLTSPRIGEWTSTERSRVFDSEARSGLTSARIYEEGRGPLIARFSFDQPTTELYMSFWVRVPTGTNFPGDVTAPGAFSVNSSWKFAWLIDTSFDGTSSDICIPSHTGKGSFAMVGNDMLLAWLGNSWWSWNSWMRISVYLYADPMAPTASGAYSFTAQSTEKGLFVAQANKPVFDADGPAEKAWRYVNIPGWLASSTNSRPVYDDVYIAVGSGAQARVEIGDNSTYTATKKLVLLTPNQWTSDSIVANSWTAVAEEFETPYLYVTDASGKTNSAGFPLRGLPIPKAPESVIVQ